MCSSLSSKGSDSGSPPWSTTGSRPLDYGVVVVSWHNEAQATLDVRFIPVPPEFSDDGEDDDEWSTWSEDRFSADAPA